MKPLPAMTPEEKEKKELQKYLKTEQAELDDIERRHRVSPDHNKVIDAAIISYVVDDVYTSTPYLTGRIKFEDGKEDEACFFKFPDSEKDIAIKIYTQTSKIADNIGILKPYFVTYYATSKSWLVCYEKFDSLLSENPTDIVASENKGDLIRSLLETIKYIHKRRLFHGNLEKRCAYVMVSGKIKILFVSGLRTQHEFRKPSRKGPYEDQNEVENAKLKDLKDFRDMISDIISEFEVPREDLHLFLEFFDNSPKYWFGYDGFVDRIIDHPSLKIPEKRNEYLFKIEQDIISNALRKASVFMKKLKDEEFTSKYSNWNDRLSEAPKLEAVYDGGYAHYQVDKVRDLIRFLANAYVHYDKSEQMEEDFDRDVQKLYTDFLNRMHIYL